MIRLERSLCALGLLTLVHIGLEAQTKVRRYDVTKETDYGIVYRLPETRIQAVFSVRERVYTPGELSGYANKYLNRKGTPEVKTTYEILSSTLRVVGVPDTSHEYLIAFDKKTTAPFVKLTDRGILYSINGSGDLCQGLTSETHSEVTKSKILPDRTQPALPREYVQAGSKAKQAAIAASYLYEVRENTMNILSGSVDNMPKDGESMRLVLERLRSEEHRAQRLFLGDTTERIIEYIFTYTPTSEDVTDIVFARFSPLSGMKSVDDLSGTPIHLSLRATERTEELPEKEQKKKEKQLEGSIVYNLPGQALVTLSYEGRTIASDKLPLTQLGSKQALAPKMFNLTQGQATAVYFDIRTGAILDIRQE